MATICQNATPHSSSALNTHPDEYPKSCRLVDEANAQLIALAPEMAEALERIRAYQGRFGEDDPQSITADVLAKISSADLSTISIYSPMLVPILMKDLHTPVEPKQLHPMLLDDAQIGNIVAFDCRERMLTIQVDEMPSGKMPGHRLGARAILVFLPENGQNQTPPPRA